MRVADTSELEVMPGDWNRALAVVAHPDDLEYGGAAAIARWRREGKTVVYTLATRGEAGIDGMSPEEAAVVREREQIAAARVVGVDTVEFLDHTDGVIEYGLPLRRDIAAAIRRHRPELVITMNHRDTWAGGPWLNTADHRNVGLATLDAVSDAANRWVFRELTASGLEPWDGVRWVAVAASPQATHAVDITDTIDLAVDSLREHRAYLEGLGDASMADPSFLREAAAEAGARFGGVPACDFELFPM